MKIVDTEVFAIRIPLKHPFTIALGTLTHSNHVLVRLIDDENRVGWGESTTFHSVYGYDQKSLYHVLNDHLLPAVKGMDPRDMTLLHQKMDQAIPRNLMAKCAVDLAAYDLAGQAAEAPIYSLIGGRRADRIPVMAALGIVAAKEAAARAKELVAEGFEMKAADVINIKVPKCGGIYRSQLIAVVCESKGIPCFLGGCLETSPGAAAQAHFYTATSNVISAAEMEPWQYVDDVVISPMLMENGSVRIPQSSGLGVIIDEDKVAHYSVAF